MFHFVGFCILGKWRTIQIKKMVTGKDIDLIAFSQYGRWGIKDSKNNLIVQAQHSHIKAFSLLEGTMVEIFNSRDRSLLLRFDNDKNGDFEKNILRYNFYDKKARVLFIVNEGYQSFLLQLEYNAVTNLPSTSGLLQEYRSHSSWSPSGRRNHQNETPRTKEADVITYNDCYRKIDYIGNNLFKVELLTPYLNLETTDENGSDSWVFRFSSPRWRIVNASGKFLSLYFEDMGEYIHDYCRVKVNGRYNLINLNTEVVNKQWFKHLLFPAFGKDDFLAGNYFLISHSLESNGIGRYMVRTTDLSNENNLNEENSYENNSLQIKLNRTYLSDKELSLLLSRVFKNDTITVDELPVMDLYHNGGMKNELKVSGLTKLTDTLFSGTVLSDFFYHFDTGEDIYKLIRHKEITEIPTVECLGFSFEQKRLISIDGAFVNFNHYHEIFPFDDNGTAVVSKTFFKSGDHYIDTSISEYKSSEQFVFWQDNGSYRTPICIKYGLIDRHGNEIKECGFERDEI